MRADIIAVEKLHAQLDIDCMEIVGNAGDVDARSEKGWPETEPL